MFNYDGRLSQTQASSRQRQRSELGGLDHVVPDLEHCQKIVGLFRHSPLRLHSLPMGLAVDRVASVVHKQDGDARY